MGKDGGLSGTRHVLACLKDAPTTVESCAPKTSRGATCVTKQPRGFCLYFAAARKRMLQACLTHTC